MEEIEERYKKEIENADSEFLKGLDDKKKMSKLEENYRIRLNNAIKKYEEECLNYLEKEKKRKIKKNSFSDNKKIIKRKIKSFSLKPSFFDKSRIKINLFFFKLRIKLKKILNKMIPLKLMLFYISAKKSAKTAIKDSGNSFQANLHRKKIKIYSTAEKEIGIILLAYSKIKNKVIILYNKLKEIISKKKKEEKKEVNKETEKDGKEDGDKEEGKEEKKETEKDDKKEQDKK